MRLWPRVVARSKYLLMEIGLVLKSAGFVATFNGANYSDRKGLNAGFSNRRCHVMLQHLAVYITLDCRWYVSIAQAFGLARSWTRSTFSIGPWKFLASFDGNKISSSLGLGCRKHRCETYLPSLAATKSQ